MSAATLRTLGERVTDGAADDLARHLPEPFTRRLTEGPGEAEPFGLEEFESRVRDRSDVVSSSRAVVAVLAEVAGPELEATREQLPSEFDVYFEPGGPTTAAEFLGVVAEREGVEEADAEVHARAVGSALADAAGAHEVDAARNQLPDPFGVFFEPPGENGGP